MHPATSTYRTPLDAIDLFVLLDLLGSANPRVPSFFRTTHWAYLNMANAEARLRSLKQLQTSPSNSFLREANKKESDRWLGGAIEVKNLLSKMKIASLKRNLHKLLATLKPTKSKLLTS